MSVKFWSLAHSPQTQLNHLTWGSISMAKWNVTHFDLTVIQKIYEIKISKFVIHLLV